MDGQEKSNGKNTKKVCEKSERKIQGIEMH
jgi:hypothetical protein